MRCLSLWQPWATLVALRAKGWETRSWGTSYRGPLAIQASKTWNHTLADLCLTEPFYAHLSKVCEQRAYYRSGNALPLGAIVCVAELTACVRITADSAPTGDERAFGDYTPGRYMWQLTNVRPLRKPVPYRASQGLFRIASDDGVWGHLFAAMRGNAA